MVTLKPPPPPSNIGRGELDNRGGAGQQPEEYPLMSQLLTSIASTKDHPRAAQPRALGISSEQRRLLGTCGSCISCTRAARVRFM